MDSFSKNYPFGWCFYVRSFVMLNAGYERFGERNRRERTMKKIVCLVCAVMLLTLSGCLDITGSFKPGSFGKTAKEQAMVEAISEKYGDLTEKGEPRILEARMTSDVQDFIPVDTVSKYSKDAKKFFVWFVYDNFDYDEIEVEWIYAESDYSIHIFTAQSGEDLGRGAFILERPDDGWALGDYEVIIRGGGVEEILTFVVITGATVATPLSYQNGKLSLGGESEEVSEQVSETVNTQAAGWYLTGWDFYRDPTDTSETGGKVGHFANGDTYTDYHEGVGDKNNFTNIQTRKLSNGNVAASGHATTVWIDPPEYFSGSERVVITVERTVDSDWGINGFGISFDNAEINPGGATSGRIQFATPDGQNYVQDYQGTFQMEKAAKGSTGAQKAIILYLNGFGYKYYYEWRG